EGPRMEPVRGACPGPEALRARPPHEGVPGPRALRPRARRGAKPAGQAPVAVEQIKKVSAKADLDQGIEAEKAGFVTAFSSDDASEGIGAFLGKRKPKWQGK